MQESDFDIGQKCDIGKRLILDAINIDETLADVLRLHVKKAKMALISGNETCEMDELAKVLRNIIIALTLTEEKISIGVVLLNSDKDVHQTD